MTNRPRNGSALRQSGTLGCGVGIASSALLILAGASSAAAQASAVAPGVATPSTRVVPPEYRIGPGDELSVAFPYNPELNHDGPVGPDGRFTLPQVGNVLLARSTIAEATATISDQLRAAGIVADARPSVTIRTYGAAVFVGGEVKTPGLVRLTSGMDPLQAVIVAGGLLDTAKSKKIVIIRRGPDGVPVQHYVDLRAYLRHGLAAGVDPLAAQDVVFVPKSSIAEADIWVDQYLNKLIPFNKSLDYSVGSGGFIR